ncbi:M20 family metallopeptidase [Bradyrhizobium sp. WSM2254]|uniref:M20 family metallopeptidase n=1 Tax=Bradyrhizobium sp. WSM2254 TaxID=1188263 RepID=UPI0003FC692A|nr:M20 family metallopeptidase [Bradyrhizobium sp. WSM2254]
MTIDALKQEACGLIEGLKTDLLGVSHKIHATPEIAFEERFASQLLCSVAESEGIQMTRGAYGIETAFAGEFGKSDVPRVALISEYDALPGLGHACGHNVIATAGLGAVLALHRMRERLPGAVRYLGTPAEERGCGKEIMARNGAFEGVEAAMMVHPAGINVKALRCICISEATVVYTGRAAHAAVFPEMGLNALDAITLSYQAIAQLRQHIRSSERIHGVITAGGVAPNTVPDSTTAIYFVRAADAEALAKLKPRVQACFDAGALASGCTVDVQWSPVDYLDMVVNEPLADAYVSNATRLGRCGFVPYERLPLAGSDMANVSHRVPVLHPLISMSPPNVMLHDPEFAMWARSEEGDKAAIDGAKALAMTAIDYFCRLELREDVSNAFKQTASHRQQTLEIACGVPAAYLKRRT